VNESGTERGSPPVDELIALVARATALLRELDAIKATSPLALFTQKLRDALPTGYANEGDVQPSGRVERVRLSSEESERALRLVGELRAAVTELQGERDAIAAESALGLCVRKALRKMPPAGALPVFSPKRLSRIRSPQGTLARLVTKTGRLGMRQYRRLRAPRPTYPRITIVTSVVNGAAHIGDTVRSVLAQDYPNLQYIVADGGSTDGTLEIVRAFGARVELLSERDCGTDESLARGVARADGDILGYLSPDGELEPQALERVGRFFAGHARVDAVYHENIVDENGWRFPNVAPPARSGHGLFHDGVFFRRAALRDGRGAVPVLMCLPGHTTALRVRPEHLRSARNGYRFGRRGRQRLFFPLDVRELPPPRAVAPPMPAEHPPVCPLTGCVPDRLLFSSPDTRHGYDPMSYVYYASESHLAIAYPHIAADLLAERLERAASNPVTAPELPSGTSPYRNYLPGRGWTTLTARAWLPARPRRFPVVDKRSSAYEETLAGLDLAGVRTSDALSLLNVGCRDVNLLERLRATTSWPVTGVETDRRLCERARASGHEVVCAGVETAGSVLPLGMRFDVVRIDEIETYEDPVAAIAALRTLLAPGGRLVLATPNLDSVQIDLFGPTWSGWNPPYRRYVFSVAALRMLAERTNMRMAGYRTFSWPALTERSMMQREHGLAAVIPDAAPVPHAVRRKAAEWCGWSNRLFDPRGRGDRIVAVFEKRP
jgi:glycosyltransferase involved in cell wall biosynthesis/SAM-dependent methyltransferase